MDWYLDWGESQFLTKQLHMGAVVYVYKQINPDSGAPVILGANESQVFGIGPQVGYLFPIGGMKGYLIPEALAVDVLHAPPTPVMAGLDPAISIGCLLTGVAFFVNSMRVRMAGTSPAMTGLESRSFRRLL